MQISQLQLLQDEQQAQHQREVRLLEEELVRLRQAVHQSNMNLEHSRNRAEVCGRADICCTACVYLPIVPV